MLQEKKRAERQLSEVKSPGPGGKRALLFRKKKQVFTPKGVSIYPERSKHFPKMSLCSGNISYCCPEYLLLLSETGLGGRIFPPVDLADKALYTDRKAGRRPGKEPFTGGTVIPPSK